jgi:hypothetical protein
VETTAEAAEPAVGPLWLHNFIRLDLTHPLALGPGGRARCALMNGWLVALVFCIPLVAFGMWLTFNAILVKWHGLEALKATPAVYRVFDPRGWSQRPDDPLPEDPPRVTRK